mmetsp:Transcript_94468/g.267192  ORF Transcript_94468/g.267192 Transcript_94468/m.267192 type:complete len:527 (-) Transcript_94468:129-1709(-)
MSSLELLRCCRRRSFGHPGSVAYGSEDWQTKPAFSFAGAGGRFIQEANYNYVGDGAGEFKVVHTEPASRCRLCIGTFIAVFVALAGALLWIVFHYGTRTVTTAGSARDPGSAQNTYNCNTGYSSWRQSWSQGKRAWCCRYFSRGCQGGTAEAQTLVPYDCVAGLNNWVQEWSPGKKQWCCRHWQTGCTSTTQAAATTTAAPYSCHSPEEPRTWDTEQRVWCCLNARRGCPTPAPTQRPAPTQQPAPCSAVCSVAGKGETCGNRMRFSATHTFAGKPGACAMAVARVSHECPFCESCVLDGSFCAGLPITRRPVSTTRYPMPYDCLAGFSSWEQSWPLVKKAWCCKHRSRGCSASTMPAPAVPQPGSTQAPATSMPPFDCLAGFAKWETKWSAQKKDWCCQNGGRGCPQTTSYHERDAPPYHCDIALANWEMLWSITKKAWCCQHKKRGCPGPMTSVPFDCAAGYENWQSGWSAAKREWCCRTKRRGCLASSSAPYDCVDGYSNWEKGWSMQKKQFCCSRVDCSSPR